MIFQLLFDGSNDDSPDHISSRAPRTNGKDLTEAQHRGTESLIVEPVTEPVVEELLQAEKKKDNEAKHHEDHKAFTLLFEKYNSKICTYLAHIVGNEEVGRDLAQETFIKAWQALPGLHNPSQVEAWLFRIARNKAIDYLRRKKVQKIFLPWKTIEEHEISGRLNTEGFEEHISKMEGVKLALEQVRPKLRECLILYVIIGMSQKKIAEILQIDENSVNTYVCLGRKEFRKAYERLNEEKIS